MLKKINGFGTTVVLVTHNRDVVNELQRRVITIDRGMIVCGGGSQLRGMDRLLTRETGVPDNGPRHGAGPPYLINEYGWLWINRDGSLPTLTVEVYKRLLGDVT